MFRILIIFLAFSASAVLAKAPTVLNLWSEDNSAGLHFNCSPIFDGSGVIDDNKIECKSKSTRYNHKANSADFDKLGKVLKYQHCSVKMVFCYLSTKTK